MPCLKARTDVFETAGVDGKGYVEAARSLIAASAGDLRAMVVLRLPS